MSPFLVLSSQTFYCVHANRSVLSESSRIARGPVSALSGLRASDPAVAALVLPGGFGAAKNLSDFGFNGADMVVDKEVERVIKVGLWFF